MKHTLRLIIALVVVALTMRTARAVTMTNPDFEAVQIGSPFNSSNPSDIPGWTHAGAVGDALLWAIGYSDISGSVTVAGSGKQFVTLGGGFSTSGGASWSTSITGLGPGTGYLLRFMMANEADFSGANQQITVDFPSGSSTGAQTFTATQTPTSFFYWRPWEDKELVFVATDTTATVRFLANTQFDVGLDNVRVSVMPTPTETIPSLPTTTGSAATHTMTPTPSPTPTASPIVTATSTQAPTVSPTVTTIACVGDCDGNHQVTVDELVKGVNIALGNLTLDQCPAFNCNGTGHVTVDCLVKSVNAALNGCAG